MSTTFAREADASFPDIGRGNTIVEIRRAQRSDYMALSALLHQLDRETPYLDFTPGERSPETFELQRRIIADTSGNAGAIFLALSMGRAIGFLQAQICPLQRLRHTLTIEIGIRRQFIGHGVGKRLFAAVEQWARDRQAHRLELTVAADNDRAIALYQRCGFAIEGRRRDVLLHDGAFMDEYVMGKLLEPSDSVSAASPSA